MADWELLLGYEAIVFASLCFMRNFPGILRMIPDTIIRKGESAYVIAIIIGHILCGLSDTGNLCSLVVKPWHWWRGC